MIDHDLKQHDIQSLSNADAVAAFFATLRYTDERVPQIPAHLGIPESLHPQIKRCERLADHDGFLQVYLFELTSVTVAATKTLARAFKNKAGNYLLVLTSDYDRIGTEFDTLYIYNMFPDKGLERLLRLVENLQNKIAKIDQAGMLDASVLGETVHPKNFNTLRRIEQGDETVIDEEESFYELASHEFMLKELANLIKEGKEQELLDLPDGIHSGLVKSGAKGVFFYFKAKRKDGQGHLHFWKYYDLAAKRIIDNRLFIANLIACRPDTPRVVADYDVFDLYQKTRDDIIKSQEDQQSLEAAPKSIDPLQQTVGTVLQSIMNRPDIERPEVIEILKYLQQPMTGVEIKELRAIYDEYQNNSDPILLIKKCLTRVRKYGKPQPQHLKKGTPKITREDLHLVCFDVLS
ncbi:MAG: hypothetical protein D6743_00405 [Calditrichaeota bacterium]|nr:MAG: hypothetical protein D6743_00405 [Calditrichota bacterium]